MPKTQTFHCDDCGNDYEYALVHGYWFADRLLEGVYFEVRYGKSGPSVKVQAEAESYFNTLNKKKFLKEARDFVLCTDILDCPQRTCPGQFENPFEKR